MIRHSNVFWARSVDGNLNVGSDYNRLRLRKDLAENPGAKYKIERITAESKSQRGFYEGAVITLWIYLDGHDYRDARIHKHYHGEANKEFNGEMIMRSGKLEKIGLSSKGKLNDGLVESVIEYLEENYAIDRTKVLDPEHYKYFRDVIYSNGEFDSYIDYLKHLNRLK